ncbi:MAG TPA: hypothetical protein VMU37_00210 [Caulobacteraceae bacterium]|nr:hypothetical protein [Caulobacteraceae bacterium]
MLRAGHSDGKLPDMERGVTTSNEPAGRDPTSLPAKLLYRRLIDTFQAGEAPDFSVGTPMAWVKAIDELLADGHVEIAQGALARLRKRDPDLQWTENILELIDLTPAQAGKASRFVDRREDDVQLVRREGSDLVVFAFCGRMHRMGLPTWMFQRWMGWLNANVVYLRDFANLHFLGGVRSWGSRQRTAISLQWIVEQLQAKRVICVGNSSGGYAAMFYGLEIGAQGVLNFSGGTNLEPVFNTFLNRIDLAKELKQAFPDLGLDLRERYLAAAKPRTVVVYGDQAWDDRIQCEHMAGVPDVELISLDGFAGHGTMPELIRRGRFAGVLNDLAGTGAAADGPP